MCGVSGVFDIKGGAAPTASVDLMCSALKHRGPDAADAWHDGPIALGHRRLAIIDLSAAGIQPMKNERGDVVLTFNGEMYNYRDHLPGLRDRGHVLRSGSDAEVVIHLYEDFGLEGALERLNGMFAFALWDARIRTLHLVRDRVGEKPLYW